MLRQQEILENLLANTLVMSRTAQTGELNAQGRPGKPVSDLAPTDLKQAVLMSMAALSGVLRATTDGIARDSNLACTVLHLEKLLFEVLSVGTNVDGGAVYRIFETGRNYGLPPREIFEAMRSRGPTPGFLIKLSERLSQFSRDPMRAIELAAWVEYEVDMRIHPYPDACGRMARAMSVWTLLLNNSPLPLYRDRTAYYAAMNGGWEPFLKYYCTCFPGG